MRLVTSLGTLFLLLTLGLFGILRDALAAVFHGSKKLGSPPRELRA